MFKDSYKKLRLLVIVLILLFPGIIFGEVVKEVRVQGLRALDEDTVRGFIDLKPGDEFDLELVAEDIKRLYGSGLVEDVKVDKGLVKEEPGFVIITYIIDEKWMVRSVRFSGNKKIKAEDLGNVIGISGHSIFDPAKVKEAQNKIRKEYENRGMFLSRVSSRIDEIKEGVVDVIFEIEERSKAGVARVEFYGNEKIKDKKLGKALQTRQARRLFTPGKFQEELLDIDRYRIYNYYLDNGFIDAKVSQPLAYLEPEQNKVYISFFIEEGEAYKVARIQLQGDLIAPEEELGKGFTLKAGEIYRESLLRRDMQYLLDYYNNLGYRLAYIDFVPARDIRREPELKLAYITLNVRKGRKLYLERIEIVGNNKTFDNVIRRELACKEGYLYSGAQVELSKARLMRLGYFDQVETFDRPGSDLERMVLEVAVKEGKRGSLMIGAGYSSLEEIFFNVQFQQRNFLGRGYNINTTFRSSAWGQDYFIDFEDPYFLNSPWNLGLNFFSYSTRYYYFDQERTGANITFGRKIPHTEYSRIFLKYRWDVADLENFSQSSQIYRRQPNNSPTSSITLGFRRNALNNFYDPTKGSYLNSSFEYAGRFLGGENEFSKANLDYSYYHPLPGTKIGHYLSIRARTGYMWFEDSERLLITERYFLGGSNSLRGFEPGSISPVFIEDSGIETRIGGNKMVAFSVDYLIPLGASGLKLSIFYDAGNAFNDNQEIDLGRLRQNWGFGLRWASPMGPLRFEFGFPIDRREGERAQVFNFGMGSAF